MKRFKVQKLGKQKFQISCGKVFPSRNLAIKYLSFINRERESIMSESLDFSTDCEKCGEELEPSESGDWYHCEKCDKSWFVTELYTY